MGEAAFESENMGNTMAAEQQKGKIKERRNGKGNIFEGIDPTVLEKLGLSEEIISQLSEEADDTLTVCVSQIVEAVKSAGSLEKCRTHRSLSTTITEEMKQALQNRQRRNAVGNLLELLSSSQQLLLVEHLQEELEKISHVHINDDTDNARGSSVSQGEIVCH